MNRGTWWAIFHRDAKSWTRLKQLSRHAHSAVRHSIVKSDIKKDRLDMLFDQLHFIDSIYISKRSL